MKKIFINEIAYLVDERFEIFDFFKKPSSNVDVVGYTPIAPIDNTCHVVVQFNKGGTYLYENVAQEDIQGAIECESIGKYYRSNISGKYTGIKMSKPAVMLESDLPSF